MKRISSDLRAHLSVFRLLLALLLILAFPGPQPSFAQPEGELTIDVPVARVRERPSLESPVLFNLEKGTVVRSTQSQEGWRRIALNDGRAGWSHGSLLSNELAQAKPESSSPKVAEKKVEAVKAPPEDKPANIGDWYRRNKDRFLMIADVNLSLILSDLQGSGSVWGGSIDGALSPTYKVSPNQSAIFLYNGSYYKKREFYSDEIGPRQRSEFMSHTVTPMYRVDFGPRSRYTLTPSIFYTRTYNKDIDSTEWRNGLYNYQDAGGGLDFNMRGMGFAGREGTLRLGAQTYKRRYPNYNSLLDLATGLGVEPDEKDYYGVILKSGYDWGDPSGLSWRVDYSLLFKDLVDKKVVDENGVLTDKKRDDYLNTLAFDIRSPLSTQLALGLGIDLNLNESNQNYYDGLSTITLADDVFIPDFYDYFSFRFAPRISYDLGFVPLIATLSYAYGETDYSDRRAQFRDGTYKDDKQWETTHETKLDLRYQLTKRWAITGYWQYIAARSNNDDESVYHYDYKVSNYAIGASFSF